MEWTNSIKIPFRFSEKRKVEKYQLQKFELEEDIEVNLIATHQIGAANIWDHIRAKSEILKEGTIFTFRNCPIQLGRIVNGKWEYTHKLIIQVIRENLAYEYDFRPKSTAAIL